MKFEYKSVTGIITIDVDEEWVTILENLDRENSNNDLKERRRHLHFEACEYEGETFAVEDPAFERFLESKAAKAIVTPLLPALTKAQRQVIDALYFKGITAKEYASMQGISEAAVSKAKNSALKKLKRNLKDG